MATAVLTPSTIYLSSSSYLSVSNESNAYADTTSSNYATVTNSRSSTTSYYAYLRGFDFSSVPNDAVVSSFTIKVKCSESGAKTTAPKLYDGTTQVSGSTSSMPSSVDVLTFSGTTSDWNTLKGYGSDFGIRFDCGRNKKNTTAYVYIYGAEIDVTYTIPTPQTDKILFKNNGTWVEAVKVYKKVNGSWVEQSDLTTVFNANTNYVKG